MASTTTATTASVHPLDPLSAAEIARAWEIVRTERPLGPRVRVIFVMLHEPAKKVVLQHRPGDAVERAAFVVLVDSATAKTYEVVVSVSAGRVLSWQRWQVHVGFTPRERLVLNRLWYQDGGRRRSIMHRA